MTGRGFGRVRRHAWTLAGVLLLQTAAALAQPPPEPRVIVGATAGIQFVKDSFSQHTPLLLHGERGEFAALYNVTAGLAYDAGVAVRVRGPLALGVEVATFRATTSTAIEATVPHPVFLGFPRHVTRSIDDVERRERALHFQGQYWREFRDTLLVRLFAGPTLFRLRHDLVSAIDAVDGATVDTVALSGYRVVTQHRADFGFNVGFDVSYYGLERLGFLGHHDILDQMALAFVVRYSQGTSAIQLTGRTVQPEYELGGTHIGGGLRVAF